MARSVLIIVAGVCMLLGAAPAPSTQEPWATQRQDDAPPPFSSALDHGRVVTVRAPREVVPQTPGQSLPTLKLAVGQLAIEAEYLLSFCPPDADHCAVVVRVSSTDAFKVLHAIAAGDTPTLIEAP